VRDPHIRDPIARPADGGSQTRAASTLAGGKHGRRHIDTAFARLVQLHWGGLVINSDSFLERRSERLAALAKSHAVPAICGFREFATAGDLMSYGAAGLLAMEQIPPTLIDLPGFMRGGFSEARSPPTCPFSKRPRSSSTSMWRPPKRSASPCRFPWSAAPTRRSNKLAPSGAEGLRGNSRALSLRSQHGERRKVAYLSRL